MVLLLFFSFLFSTVPIYGNVLFPIDTLVSIVDTAHVDTTDAYLDTTGTVKGVDSVIIYSSRDSIVYFISSRTMLLFDQGEIKYKQMQLKADRIEINWNTSILTASGVPDTSDTTKDKFRGTPQMKDGNEEYTGSTLAYNFRTKKGKIYLGRTEIEQAFYHGQDIKKVDKDILFVASGRYTTCENPEPHYYFASPKMKITMQDQVVAEPIYFYIADVPVFVLPFGVFPNKGGRRSGIIPPKYGEDYLRGRFLRQGGYFWAMGDYMDLTLLADWFTKGGWAAFADYRYALRYYFTGGLSGEYRKLYSGEKSDPRRTEEKSYRVNITHNQDIDPTTRLNVNFTFASDNSYRNTINMQQAINQSIISNATFSKSWEGTPNSITVNVGRQQNLLDGRIDETLPSFSFYHSQSYPFRKNKSSTGESSRAWYEMIGLGYSFSASNNRSKYKKHVQGIKANPTDTTVQTVESIQRDRRQLISQGIGLSISPKLGYFTLLPSVRYDDTRLFIDNQVPTRDENDSSLIISRVRETKPSGTLLSGLSAGTRFFGIVQPGILGILALRHTVEPSLGFRYSKRIVGEGSLKKQMFLDFNVGNNFEMKTIPPTKDKEPSKIQLINIGARISYDFTADSLRFSPIGVGFRTGIANVLNIGGDASFDLYQLVQTGQNNFQRVNKFLLKEEGRLARLQNFRINVSTSLSGEKKRSDKTDSEIDDDSQNDVVIGKYSNYDQNQDPDFNIPWNLSLSFDFYENKVPPYTSRSASMQGSLEFNLTEKWKFSIRSGYDIRNKQILFPQINISRDLHCWVMNFDWVPMGNWRHYQLEIRVKAPQLQDVKVTKSGSERGIY